MQIIVSVLKKELICQLRDKRTLVSMLISILAIPLILFLTFKVQSNFINKENNKQLKVAFVGETPSFLEDKFKSKQFKIQSNLSLVEGLDALHKDSLDAIIETNAKFESVVDAQQTGTINVYHKSESFVTLQKITAQIDALKSQIVSQRLSKLAIDEQLITPIVINPIDLTSNQEKFGKALGGFLPYIFVLTCLLGCLYPSIELITGEKEKGTVETILTTPASRFHILFGKILCIALMGLTLAILSVSGILMGVKFINDIPKEISETLHQILSLKFLIMLFVMLVPLSLFFGSLLTALVVRAKTFKEAQSITTPVNLVVVFPVAMALLPGVELNWNTAFIPILNLSLATKEIIAGTIELPYYFAIVFSLILLALATLYYSYKQYTKESMVL
ncbi:ABC transporter permease [Aquimarina agarivorans]|uniref:ABC transporter permease n=1 Tax=Aquimarina agarivorans TaxID=980584 RepID=UPI000248EFC9|nr:ABC transporter permease [Aquimarina agarivorans]